MSPERVVMLTGEEAGNLLSDAIKTMSAAIQDIREGFNGSALVKLETFVMMVMQRKEMKA